jgi:periplasmic divalent cation tolerance protein
MSQARIILTTVASVEAAEALARALVEERLAACVNVIDRVQSIYRWEGAVQYEKEVLLIIKTVVERVSELEARLQILHPYAVPEFVVLSPEALSGSYLAWLVEQTS